MQIYVHRRLHVQADPHPPDHLKIGGLWLAGKGKNIWSSFEAVVVGRSADNPAAVPAMDGVGSAGS
jgi:hypothetical protein